LAEEKVTEIEDSLSAELTKRREIERKLIILNEQVRNLKQVEHFRRLSHFIQTKYSIIIYRLISSKP
jgi:hypothetical protein